MRRFFAAILIALFLFDLYGCGSGSIMEPVTFYYPRQRDTNEAFAVVVENGVLGSEVREAAGHGGDLNYLLSLYLRGPLDSALKSPFPANCKLMSVIWDTDTLRVTLDSTFTTLENMERTLACACLAKTCFSLAEVERVQIVAAAPDSGDNIDVIIGIDSLLLEDSGAATQPSAADETQ